MRLIDADILIAELKESALHHCNNPREDSLLQRDRVIVRAQPTVEAISKADYENRLKADMVAILKEVDLQFDKICFYKNMGEWKTVPEIKAEYKAIIQQKINALKGENNGDR